MAAVTAAIGVAVAINWTARRVLIAAAVLNLAYWILGQGLGGLFQGGATDPNAGPLYVLLAAAIYALVPYEQPLGAVIRRSQLARSPQVSTDMHVAAGGER